MSPRRKNPPPASSRRPLPESTSGIAGVRGSADSLKNWRTPVTALRVPRSPLRRRLAGVEVPDAGIDVSAATSQVAALARDASRDAAFASVPAGMK